jgi:hypothetical protein
MADFESLEKQIEELARMTAEGFTGLRGEMDERFEKVDKRFDNVDEKLSGVHRRIDDEVEQRHQLATHVSKLEEKFV